MSIFKENRGDVISNRTFFGDKIYSDFDYFNRKKTTTQKVKMQTPIKTIKEELIEITQRNKAFNDLLYTAVFKIRQPIESFFN